MSIHTTAMANRRSAPVDSNVTMRRLGAARSASLLAIAALLSGCQPGILTPQGPIGAAEKTILFDALTIMLAVVVPTILATVVFAWWYRASNKKANYLPDWAYSGRIELVVWSIPLLVILFLGGICWIGSHDLDPAAPLPSDKKPVDIQVVSLDWKWLFIYPNQRIASVNQLVLPTGTPVHFTLTSASVMNAFFVPQLGSMIYTMNGMSTRLNLQVDRPGTYYGQSSHFSGDGFSDMHFDVKAVTANEFGQWTKRALEDSVNFLDANSYAGLTKQSSKVQPAIFRLADPGLYNSIVLQKLAPGPGPGEQPWRDVSPRMEKQHAG